MEEANKLIGTGQRHLVMGDAVSAVNVLQEACAMLAKTYGDTADECGEAFFLCGKALLELARMENTVLGNALEGVPEEDVDAEEEKPKDSNVESTDNVDEKTRDELRVQVYDAMAEEEKKGEGKNGDSGDSAGKEGEDKKEERNGDSEKSAGKEEEDKKEERNGDSEKSAGKEEEDKKEETSNGHVNGTDSANGEKKEEKGENGAEVEMESSENLEKEKEEEGEGEEEEEDEDQEGDGTAEKDSDDEEVGNLQLAWEMLEVAKVIYKRKETDAGQLLAAQAHLKLGEVAAEAGNYTQAVEDFQECLTLQLKHLPSDSRLLAETHCQLGLTLSLSCQYKQAIEQFDSSMAVINSRMAKLQKAIDEAEGPEAAAEERKEMEELKTLLPDIKEKVADAAEDLKSKMEAMEDVLAGESPFPAPSAQNGSTSTQNGSTTVTTIPVKSTIGNTSAASDISHLVRKKRKPESPIVEKDSKKAKPEACVNGSAHSKANGV